MEKITFGFGATESPKDKRTVKHEEMATMAGLFNLVGGYPYSPNEIEHQRRVGICTAISLVQNAQKYIGIKFSSDFQYLLQKKFYDLNWIEGSSIFHALKVGKNYGFLPIEHFPYVTEDDRNLPYAEYIEKLKAIPDSEINRLIAIASDYKLTGYAEVDVSGPFTISKAIENSKTGIICRYNVGKEWYTNLFGNPSRKEADINPLRPPQVIITGHAIIMGSFDYSTNTKQILTNTWSSEWCRKGNADVMFNNYKPTEAWIPYYGLTEVQLQELKAKLVAKIGIMSKLIALWKQLKSLIK